MNRASIRFLLLFLLLPVFTLSAESIKLKVHSETTVTAGKSFKISVEITGGSNISLLSVPDSDPDITITQSGSMSNISIINGVYTSSQTITFYARINSEGTYTLEPFRFRIGSKEYTTEELKITVTGSSTSTIPDQSSESDGVHDQARNYFLKIEKSKTEIYVNEYFDIGVHFYTGEKAQVTSYKGLQFPTTAWIKDLTQKKNHMGRVKIDSRTYDNYEMEKKRIFISKPGTVTIPSVIFNFNGIDRNSFFFYEPMSLRTKETVIEVKPLPENAPQGFAGAVGSFSIKPTLTPQQLKVKEPATLKITVTGVGNFHTLENIGYNGDRMIEEYSSKSDFSPFNGTTTTKTWEILLVPDQPGNFQISVKDFHYFDPETESYKSIPGQIFNLSVQKGTSSEESSIFVLNNNNNNNNSTSVENLNTIQFISMNKGTRHGTAFFTVWSTVIILLYFLLILGFFSFLAVKYIAIKNLRNRPVIRRRMAVKVFKQSIDKIYSMLSSKKTIITGELLTKFADLLASSFEIYFRDRFRIDSLQFTTIGIKDMLSGHISDTSLSRLTGFITNIDMVRFGGLDLTREKLIHFLDESNTIIYALEEENSSRENV